MTPRPPRLRPCRTVLRAVVFTAACAGVTLASPQDIDTDLPEDSVPAGLPAGVTLTKVADVFQVPRDTDNLSFPVEIEGVVILTVQESASFFFHDGQMGIHVSQPGGARFNAGDRVRVIGRSRRGRYAPSIIPQKIIRLGEGEYPEPRPASFSQILSTSMDSQWVEVAGVVCAVSASPDKHYAILDLARDGTRLRTMVSSPLPLQPELLLDSEVRVRGVAAGRFNPHGQMIEPWLRVPGNSWITVTRPGPADPFALPVRSVSRLLEFSLDYKPQHRVKVQGVVTRRFSDTTFFLRDEGHGLKVAARDPVVLQEGDRIEAAGFPFIENNEVVIQNAVSKKNGAAPLPAPVRSDVMALLNGSHASDLVIIQARLVDWGTDGPSTTLILEAGKRLFKGVLRQTNRSTNRVMPERDSLVDVTGICVVGELEDDLRNYQPRSFLLLLATPADLRVLQSPPWWTAARLWRALLVTLALLAAGIGWVWALRRQVQRKRSVIEYQASHAAVLEERSRIARDLHDTLEQGLTGLSLQFKAIETDLGSTPHPASSRLSLARHMLRQSRALARNAIRELRDEAVPTPQENLVQALGKAAAMWNHSGALTVKMHVTGDPHPLPPDVEHHLIGIGTEAMTNAVKHGRATTVRAEVRFEGALVRLCIKDNGVGFDTSTIPAAAQGSFGLVGMRERAAEMGARINVQSQPGLGATITVEVSLVPHPHPERAGSQTSPHPAAQIADFS